MLCIHASKYSDFLGRRIRIVSMNICGQISYYLQFGGTKWYCPDGLEEALGWYNTY